MYSLYIDTHYINLVMALFLNGKVIDKRVLMSNLHSINTVNLLDNILKDNKISIDDIKLVIVINGPGSFTGVRIGVVVAKMIGYCKNVPIKAITALKAMVLNQKRELIVGFKDRNGAFLGKFDENHNLIGDYFYLSNSELATFNEEIIFDLDIFLEDVYKYLETQDVISPHLLKPLYVKRLEVYKC